MRIQQHSGSSFTTTEFFRLYSPSSTDHFYTTSISERDYALTIGQASEGIACHVLAP